MDHTIEQTLNLIMDDMKSVMAVFNEPGTKGAIEVELSIQNIGNTVELLINVVRKIAEKQHMLHDESSWRF